MENQVSDETSGSAFSLILKVGLIALTLYLAFLFFSQKQREKEIGYVERKTKPKKK